MKTKTLKSIGLTLTLCLSLAFVAPLATPPAQGGLSATAATTYQYVNWRIFGFCFSDCDHGTCCQLVQA